jgi:hypothetical protein
MYIVRMYLTRTLFFYDILNLYLRELRKYFYCAYTRVAMYNNV